MAARSFQLTLAAGAKRLSDVYGDGTSVVNAVKDIPYREIHLSPSGADAFIGGSDHGLNTSSNDYGNKVDADALVPHKIGPFETGPVKLSDLYAAGASSTLHILAIPF